MQTADNGDFFISKYWKAGKFVASIERPKLDVF